MGDLPQPYLHLVELFQKQYSKGDADYSATELYRPCYQRRVELLHKDEIVRPPAKQLFAMMGSALHYYIAKLFMESKYPYTVEQRWFNQVDDKKLSGTPDMYDHKDGIIYDWKLTGTWAFSGNKDEYIYQLNTLAWLARKNGKKVTGLCNIILGRDWHWRRAKNENDYPDEPVMAIWQPVWSDEKIEAFIRARITMHEQAAKLDPKDIPLCTKEERWERGKEFRVVPKGQKKSRRNRPTYEEAELWIADNKPEEPEKPHNPNDDDPAIAKHYKDLMKKYKRSLKTWESFEILEKPGELVRCEEYCNARPWCRLYKGA
jgi:hypothetical protein